MLDGKFYNNGKKKAVFFSGRHLWIRKKVIENFFFLIMTTNSKLWVRKTRFRITFFYEEALSGEQLVRKFGKTDQKNS